MDLEEPEPERRELKSGAPVCCCRDGIPNEACEETFPFVLEGIPAEDSGVRPRSSSGSSRPTTSRSLILLLSPDVLGIPSPGSGMCEGEQRKVCV